MLLVLTARAVELEMCLSAPRATAVMGSCCSLPSDQVYRAATGEPNVCLHSAWPACTTGGVERRECSRDCLPAHNQTPPSSGAHSDVVIEMPQQSRRMWFMRVLCYIGASPGVGFTFPFRQRTPNRRGSSLHRASVLDMYYRGYP